MVKASHRGVKTTVEIPRNLWLGAKHYALDKDFDLRNVIVSALEKFLGMKAEIPEFRDRRRKRTKKEDKHAR